MKIYTTTDGTSTDPAINYSECYERELKQRQQEHLDSIQRQNDANWQPCLHDQCPECHGTGIRKDGGMCVHNISCPCPKCTPSY